MSSILQTQEWAEFKKTQGFSILKLGNIYIHRRQLPLGENFLYLPEVSADDISPHQVEELKNITKNQKSVFTRLELIDRFSENSYKLIRSFGFQKAFEQVQPKWRQIVNLELSEEELLSQMKSKGRYNIKVAQKHQVEIKNYELRIVNDDKQNSHLKTFFDLYCETVRREGISGRPSEYFVDMVDKFSDTDYLEIYIASFQGKPLAAALVTFYDGTASYLYGGSSREHKEVMAPYLMHWQIIKDTKEKGMKIYDLLGRSLPSDVPTPEGSGIPTESVGKNSKWSGVTRFKEQFGGEAVEILGSYDFVNKPFFYKVFKFFEKMRRNQI